jgi:hypothetical protein
MVGLIKSSVIDEEEEEEENNNFISTRTVTVKREQYKSRFLNILQAATIILSRFFFLITDRIYFSLVAM